MGPINYALTKSRQKSSKSITDQDNNKHQYPTKSNLIKFVSKNPEPSPNQTKNDFRNLK